MEVEERIHKPSPYDRVNFVSKILFTWVFPIFLKGHRKDLEFSDLYRCTDYDQSERVVKKLERTWQAELTKKKPSLARAMAKAFVPEFIPYVLLFVFNELVLRVGQPLLVGRVVRYFKKDNEDITYQDALFSSFALIVCLALFISIQHPIVNCVFRIGMRMRVACCTLMYKKSMKLSRSALGRTTVGQIINLMTNDVNRFDELSNYFHSLFVAPTQSILILYLLWRLYIGMATFAGFALLLLFIPFSGFMGRMFQKVRRKTAQLTDGRIRIMNEIITGMRVIKMYAWEKSFADLVHDSRKREVNNIAKACLLKAINLSIYFVASRIILFVCFITYISIGGRLSADSVFVTMAFFNILRITVTKNLPQGIAAIAECLVACKRIQTLLELEEIETTERLSIKPQEINANKLENDCEKKGGIANGSWNKDVGININDIVARWSQEITEPTLDRISAQVKPGELLAVVGPVGSGKSSLLMSLLKELPLESGSIKLNGQVAFASQEPWSFNASVRNNILFGASFDETRYNKVIQVCALERDFKLFPFGDKTLVGERGVSLSGGQKARITLARALYRDADVYLLDDPLSAVDTAVAKHIFNRCIVDYLKSKARILVTHQIQFIQKATKILVLNNGKSVAFGSYDELTKSGVDFLSLLGDKKKEEEKNKKPGTSNESALDFRRRIMMVRSVSVASSIASSIGETQELPSESLDKEDEPKIKEEVKEVGSIRSSVYWEYVKAGAGPVMIFLTLFSLVASQGIYHGSDLFLSEWTNHEDRAHADNSSNHESAVDEAFYVSIYSLLIGGLFVLALMRTITFFTICMRSSVNLHNMIFSRILRLPIAVFDNNPVGRILNRFSKDTGIVDENLPATAFELNMTLSNALGIMIIISIVSWYMVFPALFLIVVVVFCRAFYIKAARDIKRFEGLARSPVFSHVTTTLSGLATVRAFKAQDEFERQFYRYQNDHTATFFLFICSSRGFGLMMDWVCLLYVATICVFIMLIGSNIEGGEAGLALSSALMLTGMTQWGVRQSAELESHMTSVERMIEYARIEPEAPLESTADHKPSSDWPDKGHIQWINVSLSYANMPKPVLKDLNCRIGGGEKIGIVGRTGAGKSSVIAGLFRMTEPEGTILIDGVDIKTIGLHDLRKKISIIPQDPVVFTGPVRRNIDPFDEHTDEKLWSVLEEVQLKDAVMQLPGHLNAELTEGGSNFSVGQRQLVCLARAILRENKVLVLDEATANVDLETDSLIQKTIRDKFDSCTVLTIAHRLNTIIDSDKVLVLDAGEIVEFDEPYILLKNPEGAFSKLVHETGKAMGARLQQAAKEAYFNKWNKQGASFTRSDEFVDIPIN